ncbi:MAG: MmgE/PrpD family protein [Burkholderiaceae bacterium]
MPKAPPAPSPENLLARWVSGLDAAAVPDEARLVVQRMVLAVCGTGLAGAAEDGVQALRELLLEAGGQPQATTFVFGDRLPAQAAAQFNGTLCRALDYCDAMAPGPHFGAAVFPAALAAAELAGGCAGGDFLAALAAGAEVGARLNLTEAQYDGFDPTGVPVVFAATAAAARVLRLDPAQTLQALALAFTVAAAAFRVMSMVRSGCASCRAGSPRQRSSAPGWPRAASPGRRISWRATTATRICMAVARSSPRRW